MGKEILYFDNAATTWPKPETVNQKVCEVLREVPGNPGRGMHSSSVAGNRIISNAREEIADFFHLSSPDHVIFTFNGTDSLNIALKGLISPGNKVLVGPYEHNSVMRPLNSMQKNGVHIEQAGINKDFTIDSKSIEDICKNGIDYAIFSHVSNVTGFIADIKEISKIVHNAGGLLIIDAAQSAGILDIDMQELGIDILTTPGHKGLMGPMGTGLLLLVDTISIKPFREGGTGILSEEDFQPDKLPFSLEAGTHNLPAIAGLLEGIRFIKDTKLHAIAAHKSTLTTHLVNGLKQMKGITLYCNEDTPQTGVISFTTEFAEPSVIETVLDQVYHIQVRSGLHCAPNTHRHLGTFPQGSVRVSLGFYNTLEEIDTFLSALQGIANFY